MSVSLHRLKQEDAFAADVRAGLGRKGQKTLPSKYFYDPRGSDLFEAITRLPEYGLTRADERVLLSHGREIVESIRGPLVIAELGSGSATKTRHILETAVRRTAGALPQDQALIRRGRHRAAAAAFLRESVVIGFGVGCEHG